MFNSEQPENYQASWFLPDNYGNGNALIPSIESNHLDKFIKGDVSKYEVLDVVSIPSETLYGMTHVYLFKKDNKYLYHVFESSKETGSVAIVITPIVLDRLFDWFSNENLQEAKDHFNNSKKIRNHKV